MVQIYQADMSFILQDKIPWYSYPFIDNLPIKSVTIQYKNPDCSYKTTPDNPDICHFIWEHLQVIHQIPQHSQNIGVMVSAKKSIFTVLDATIIGHKCNFDSHIPHQAKVQKICDWPNVQASMWAHSAVVTRVMEHQGKRKRKNWNLIYVSLCKVLYSM